MELSQKILAEISQITRDIEDNYPELQKYLDENPLTLSDDHNNSETSMNNEDLKEYLESLKELVRKYKEEH
ncbi:hypothetical protein M0G43_02810 [Subsaxibacter sp. CAU 1640]|uniref:hypothetical protein n=1 Tax=Subsaxibacter sp. CAU 1640 TaxID=2933271 RepID=UPI0020062ED4|nr:hypothetical protein [Subsaxibacter sp. CAU 1640]MCK7589496.1 hypothetical protein [Subsaxibacter sp. CAU 1640]